MEQVSSRSRLGAPGALLQAAEELQERGLAVLDASPLKATCAAASKEALRLPPRLLRAAPTASDHKVSIADGLLGEDGTQQVASILDLTKESRLELPALKRLVEQSEQLCRDLAREGAELVPGNLATSEPLLLEACTPLSLTPALEELTEESAQYWSDLYGRQVYQVLLFLGPAEGSLHLQHFEGSASTKVAVGPGTLVLLRPDLLARHFEPIPGAMSRCFVFNTFLVSPAPRRQEGTLPPYVRDLVDWCMHRLKTVKLLELDGDKALSAIPASWLRAAHAEIAFGEQAAIAGSAVWTPGPDVEEPAGLELAAFAGADFVIEIPHTRFDLQEWLAVEEHDEQKMYCRHGTFVDGADMFDHKFFGIAEKQVRTMPLSERWGLEVGYEALFRAGYTKQSLRRLKGDVLVGMHTTENQLNYRTPEARSFGIGGSQAREANLLSFYLNLIGQSIVFDTDGSSSFAALHHAQMEQSAEQNEPPEFGRGAPFSLVLSTFLNVSPACFVNFCLRGLTDVRGRCFAFDSSAKGLVRGEGSAALVLRRLFGTSKEGSDTDVREGLVRAVEMIQSPAASLTHASEVAMQETVDLALARSSCRAYGIDWVECHAAGDALADALEARACCVILDEGRAPAPSTPTASRTWSMTDYKTSIGSTYAAAGLLSLLRSLHCARLTLLPGSPMLRQMNPLVDEALSSLSFPTEPMALRTLYATQTGLALVNSFGSSGSLASAVIWADVGEALPKLAPARASPPKTWR